MYPLRTSPTKLYHRRKDTEDIFHKHNSYIMDATPFIHLFVAFKSILATRSNICLPFLTENCAATDIRPHQYYWWQLISRDHKLVAQWWWKGFEQSCSNKHFCHRQNMERAIGSWRNLGVVNRCGWAGACMGLVGFPDSPFRLTSQVASQLVRCSRLVCARINIAGHSMLRLECHRDNLDSL